MNADTGVVHTLDGILKPGEEARIGFPITGGMLAEADEVAAEKLEGLEALKGELEEGAQVVGVSEEVVQRQRLGQRELERRRSRKRPPGPPDPPHSPRHRPVG